MKGLWYNKGWYEKFVYLKQRFEERNKFVYLNLGWPEINNGNHNLNGGGPDGRMHTRTHAQNSADTDPS